MKVYQKAEEPLWKSCIAENLLFHAVIEQKKLNLLF